MNAHGAKPKFDRGCQWPLWDLIGERQWSRNPIVVSVGMLSEPNAVDVIASALFLPSYSPKSRARPIVRLSAGDSLAPVTSEKRNLLTLVPKVTE